MPHKELKLNHELFNHFLRPLFMDDLSNLTKGGFAFGAFPQMVPFMK
jgi:hypothetical protein